MSDYDPSYTLPRLPAAPGRRGLDAESVRSAYARWARLYDFVFGRVSAPGRRRAVAAVNRLPGRMVLEVGVGTGLALPHYRSDKCVTGIDLSPQMLARARTRSARLNLAHVAGLLEMDAEATSFADDSFDIAVAMFVATVVPDARRLLLEMKRVVRPGGHLLFVNHFEASADGPRRATERLLAPASRALGWHPDFAIEELLGHADRQQAQTGSVPPFGLFTLVQLDNRKSA